MNYQFSQNPQAAQVKNIQQRFCRRALGRICLALTAGLAISQGIGILLGVLIELNAPGALENSWVLMGISTLPLYLCGLPVTWLILRPLPVAVNLAEHSMKAKHFLAFSAVSYALLVIANLVGLALISITTVITGREMTDPMQMLLNIDYRAVFVVVGLLAPIIEEFVFRWLILRRLLPGGELFAIIASSLMFGFFHTNPFQFLFSFSVGICLSYITIRTGRLVYATLVHIIINTFNGVLLPLALERSEILMTFVGFGILLVVMIGIILLVLYRKRIHITPPSPPLSTAGRLFQGICSPGVWAFVLLTTLLSVVVALSY